MKLIKKSLDGFAKTLVQRTNLDKSKLLFYPISTKKEANKISREVGILVIEDLGRYLGMQLVHQRHGKEGYTQLLDKYIRRTEGWKSKTLILARRITLANYVITSLPVYQMQTT